LSLPLAVWIEEDPSYHHEHDLLANLLNSAMKAGALLVLPMIMPKIMELMKALLALLGTIRRQDCQQLVLGKFRRMISID
jgi:hypothetical protein